MVPPTATRQKRKRHRAEPQSKRRALEDSKLLIDLTSIGLSTLELPPVKVVNVRLALQSALDPDLQFQVGQIAVHGRVIIGSDPVDLWTPLPHDRAPVTPAAASTAWRVARPARMARGMVASVFCRAAAATDASPARCARYFARTAGCAGATTTASAQQSGSCAGVPKSCL